MIKVVISKLSFSALSQIGSLNIDMSVFGKSKSASPLPVRANFSAPTSLELLDPRRQVCGCDGVCVSVYMHVCGCYIVCVEGVTVCVCVCGWVCVSIQHLLHVWNGVKSTVLVM